MGSVEVEAFVGQRIGATLEAGADTRPKPDENVSCRSSCRACSLPTTKAQKHAVPGAATARSAPRTKVRVSTQLRSAARKCPSRPAPAHTCSKRHRGRWDFSAERSCSAFVRQPRRRRGVRAAPESPQRQGRLARARAPVEEFRRPRPHPQPAAASAGCAPRPRPPAPRAHGKRPAPVPGHQ